MKNIKFAIILFAVAILNQSCETYDDYNTDRPTNIGFVTTEIALVSLSEGQSQTRPANVYINNVADVDRTFNVVVYNEFNSTTTSPENYSFDSTVLIPAGSHDGTINITITDVSLTPETTEFLTLAIEENPDYVSGGRVTVSLQNRLP
ncbi:hypothetical protein [Aequorivita echinoideorum]|uniref:Calx-beta domain-containing protein n=1 Tax=Aequorivita echinoideorum TaxID=1549647 RepID=A0ABS5S059_9FLAO|nr:hypothetical protein [Aequorivita echinoideorum]MBT0606604.1 hypothetical protein [Aequorivita echinoideorum]